MDGSGIEKGGCGTDRGKIVLIKVIPFDRQGKTEKAHKKEQHKYGIQS